ncbi:SGNH/GDSL hydrolase family protein [Oleiharenicola lentus]|jgi:lysophospholipase L1-like esterase|uniref:SGNH/GDSL hydrolase family protein n=1 Tax=Oleiharenicola lentus TaxID=2508720 RepID=A0A4Q1C7N7_9BACT|nr:SGNH/GDSL hydrolase family protein [Oleiharenicola lentus]RXK54934.1 SGNH/GDSL hydrolase family protein [Oleiharenicola lentus]
MSRKSEPSHPSAESGRRASAATKAIIVLLTLVIGLGGMVAWLWTRRATPVALFPGATQVDNLIRKKFPETDFARVYPGMSADDIDRLQRESLGIRYVYAPFVEFAPKPVAGRFVNVNAAGYREGRAPAPWPPVREDFTVFVFGGSTTFGFGLPDGQTLVSALEAELARRWPQRTVRCYNFGRGYYFSAQERALFESLLAQGVAPDLAVFVDGLNDFIYHDGVPELTEEIATLVAPDLPPPARVEPADDAQRGAAVDRMIAAYARHVKLTEALGRAAGVPVIFVGQPVPFLDFPMSEANYPFKSTFAEHRLASWGYGRFKEAARLGRFGDRFVWCGNAFARAETVMYADSIHYSAAGAELLARTLVERAAQVELWP